jgi:hypothetical protein
MYRLVLKDILIQKKTLIITMIYAAFFILIFHGSLGAGSAYTAGSVVMSYLLIMYGTAYDDKNKADFLFNSFPVKREDIVLAKYVSAFTFTIIASITCAVFVFIIKVSGIINLSRFYNLSDFFGTLVGVGFISSLYYPVFFKLGYMKARLLNFFLFLVLGVVPPIFTQAIKSFASKKQVLEIVQKLSNKSDLMIGTGLALFAVILILFSIALSMQFYRKREF